MRCKKAILSTSLGHRSAGHSLLSRLAAAKQHGFDGFEISYEDIIGIHKSLFGEGTPGEDPVPDAQINAARLVALLCGHHDIKIMCLQPFLNYEGLLDPTEHANRILKLDLWIRMAETMKTDLILVPSNFLPADHVSFDFDHAVSHLRKMADMGAAKEPPIRFAYEALCWGTRINSWHGAWAIVRAVNRDNFGICLDTFNIAARVYADPTRPDGLMPNGEARLKRTLDQMVDELDVKKIFYVQIADAEKLAEPMSEGHKYYKPGQRPKMSWSRNCRLFYDEKDLGGYLPIEQIGEAIFQRLGYEGWVSFELFNAKTSDRDTGLPTEMARRAAESWVKMVRDFNLRVGSAVRDESSSDDS